MDRSEFPDWVRSTAPGLHRAAYLLTGDWALAQDLVQHSCAVVWTKWGSLEHPDAYVRKVMARTATSWRGRRWRGEVSHADLPDEARPDIWGDVDRRTTLMTALRQLPMRQRAVVVLRFYDDLSEAATAEALGWPVGTVKSTTSRALEALRRAGLDEQKELFA